MRMKLTALIGICLIIAGFAIVAYGYGNTLQTVNTTLNLTVVDSWDTPIYNAKVTLYFWLDPYRDTEPHHTLEYYTDQNGQVTYAGYYFVNGLRIEKEGYDTFYNKGWIWEGAHTITLSGGEPQPQPTPEPPPTNGEPPDVGPPIDIPDLSNLSVTVFLGLMAICVGLGLIFARP